MAAAREDTWVFVKVDFGISLSQKEVDHTLLELGAGALLTVFIWRTHFSTNRWTLVIAGKAFLAATRARYMIAWSSAGHGTLTVWAR